MMKYEKPEVESVLFSELTYVMTISSLPEVKPGENEMPLG